MADLVRLRVTGPSAARPDVLRAAFARRLCACVALLIALVSATAQAQPALRLAPEIPGLPLGRHIAVLEDPTGTLGIDDVREGERARAFVPAQADAPGFGFTSSAYWVRFRVENGEAHRRSWLLELAYPHLDRVELYVPRESGGFDVRRAGDHQPFAQRELKSRNLVFTLDEPAQSERTYYLRAVTSGSMNLPLVAWSALAFVEHQDQELSAIWMFYGLMLVMAVYNGFIFFFVRQREYLFYSLFIVSLALFQATLNGHTFQYLLPNQIWLANHVLPCLIGLNFLWTTLFVRDYLALPQTDPGHDKLSIVAIWIFSVLAIFGLVGPYAWSIRVLVLMGGLLTVLAPLFTALLAFKGSRPAKLYLLSWGALIAGVLLYLGKSLGLFPTHFVTTWGIQIGASFQAVILSLALADRINTMRSDLSQLNLELSRNVENLEAALKRAEEATRAKSDFLANVSHELRTPLNAIINLPQALLEDVHTIEAASCEGCSSMFELEPGDALDASTACPDCGRTGTLRAAQHPRYTGQPAQLVKCLGHIERSGRHLLQMVSGILDVSKIEAGKFELSLGRVELAAMLRDAVEPLIELAKSKGVSLELAPPADDATLRGDALRLKQVLINLIGNAIKFSNGQGRVLVSVEPRGADYLFSVSDQGIGIAPEHRERIFESFEQVDRGDTRKYGGTGLGLTISRSLVEMHGGTIWVESTLGQGSTFFFRIPAAGPATNETQANAVSTAAASAPHIFHSPTSTGAIKELRA